MWIAIIRCCSHGSSMTKSHQGHVLSTAHASIEAKVITSSFHVDPNDSYGGICGNRCTVNKNFEADIKVLRHS
jgi:hypothetical protein